MRDAEVCIKVTVKKKGGISVSLRPVLPAWLLANQHFIKPEQVAKLYRVQEHHSTAPVDYHLCFSPMCKDKDWDNHLLLNNKTRSCISKLDYTSCSEPGHMPINHSKASVSYILKL